MSDINDRLEFQCLGCAMLFYGYETENGECPFCGESEDIVDVALVAVDDDENPIYDDRF